MNLLNLAVLLTCLFCHCIYCNLSRQDMLNKHRKKMSADNKNMIEWDNELEQEAKAFVDKCDYNPNNKFEPNRGFNLAVYPDKRKTSLTMEGWNVKAYAPAEKIGCAAKWCSGNLKRVEDWDTESGTLYLCIYSPKPGGQSQSTAQPFEPFGFNDCWPQNAPQKYNGNVSVTVSKKECQSWNMQTPHNHTIGSTVSDFVDGDMDNNHCRFMMSGKWENEKAGEVQVPWCYTQDEGLRWEKCAVKPCLFFWGDQASSADRLTAVTSLITWTCTAAAVCLSIRQ